MAQAKTAEEWAEHVSAFLKHQLRESGTTYQELARRIRRYGFKETEASITNKLKRGTFPATFFLAVLKAIGVETVRLNDV